ncbi:YozQ family protein [Aeribacillus sp. FSL K6-1305]|jgi:Protein of unknown function (DUF4025)|uniref:YozQ family protein n=1 Tax=Aeribacillus sp. FSL K6-1305 TaxID=2954569 RepID=UPI0030FD34C3
MTEENDKKNETDGKNIAGKIYTPNDYKSHSESSQGLAVTHEQVSDTFTEGTIDGEVDNIKIRNRLKDETT